MPGPVDPSGVERVQFHVLAHLDVHVAGVADQGNLDGTAGGAVVLEFDVFLLTFIGASAVEDLAIPVAVFHDARELRGARALDRLVGPGLDVLDGGLAGARRRSVVVRRADRVDLGGGVCALEVAGDVAGAHLSAAFGVEGRPAGAGLLGGGLIGYVAKQSRTVLRADIFAAVAGSLLHAFAREVRVLVAGDTLVTLVAAAEHHAQADDADEEGDEEVVGEVGVVALGGHGRSPEFARGRFFGHALGEGGGFARSFCLDQRVYF